MVFPNSLIFNGLQIVLWRNYFLFICNYFSKKDNKKGMKDFR